MVSFAAGPMMVASKFKKGGVIINLHTLPTVQTRAYVEALSRWFDFIHHDELLDRLARPRTRPFCLLTFDDGKLSNFTETAPELTRLGVPAVFYVPTQALKDGTPLWFDRYAALQKALGHSPAGLEPWIVKRIPLALLNERLDRVCKEYGVTLDLGCDDISPMSWGNARELARRGYTIGAHGLRHAILTRETEADALTEIEQSIGEVTSELGVQCTTFAFPNGNYTARLAHHALSCGVQTVMTTEPMWADSTFHSWRLPRIQLFGGGRSRMELKLALAATGQILSNPDGTGRLYRKINRLGRRRTQTCGKLFRLDGNSPR